jgi:hypothetical protein
MLEQIKSGLVIIDLAPCIEVNYSNYG